MSAPQSPNTLWIQLFTTTRNGPVRWRVLARNHREFARGVQSYDTADRARHEIARTIGVLPALRGTCYLVRPHTWRWEFQVDGQTVLHSSRVFDRQPRCAAALRYAQQHLVDATITDRLATYVQLT